MGKWLARATVQSQASASHLSTRGSGFATLSRPIWIDPGGQHAEQVAGRAVIETPLALLQKQVEVCLRDAVVAPQMPLRLVPEIFDPIDVSTAVDKRPLVVDPLVTEFGNIQYVMGSIAICVDNAIGLDALTNDANKRPRPGIGYHPRIDFSIPFEQAKHRHFAGGAASPFALADATKIAFIDLDFTNRKRRFNRQSVSDQLAQLVVKQDRRPAVHPHQLSRQTGRRPGYKLDNQSSLNTRRKPAPPPDRNHMIDNAFLRYLRQPQKLYRLALDHE